jgi:hypothetical protein
MFVYYVLTNAVRLVLSHGGYSKKSNTVKDKGELLAEIQNLPYSSQT